jgi:putative aldouronate transport system substrate-binding protein
MKLQLNVYMSAMTDTMTSKLPTFKKLAEETISQIIYGKAPVEQWDTMVAEWNKLGGDEILKEVTEYAQKGK